MLAAVVLAVLTPRWGASGGSLHLARVTQLGVGAVFFLHGAGLSIERLRSGAGNWRLHLFVQSATFLVFPLVGLSIEYLGAGLLPKPLRDGLFYLCALNSTVASSIALTAVAGGDVAAAVFNATLSSLIGMLATPLWVDFGLHAAGRGFGFDRQLLGIGRQLLLPFVGGLLTHRWLGATAARHRRAVGGFDRAVIILIVYGAFCDATQGGLWRTHALALLAQATAAISLLLALALGLTTWAARRVGFPLRVEVVAVFCGSKKSLAVGVPMARLLFAPAQLGMMLLPLMLYHQLQLLVCALLAQRYARRLRDT
ncbi:MAG: bile acid:sodium symporter [Gammaproteobacteria bacterium]|nr:bile acid:sodium symporter [Gammaproteobacteria bacterium]